MFQREGVVVVVVVVVVLNLRGCPPESGSILSTTDVALYWVIHLESSGRYFTGQQVPSEKYPRELLIYHKRS